MAHSLSMLTNCYEGAELTLRYEILNSLKWQQATQKYGTLACSAAPAHLGIKLEHSTTQATTTLFGTQQMSRKIWKSLEIGSSHQWQEGDVEVSMEKEYEYPESWRGTAASTPPLWREYYYWSNPARYYRHRTYYPRYLPRYRSRYYR